MSKDIKGSTISKDNNNDTSVTRKSRRESYNIRYSISKKVNPVSDTITNSDVGPLVKLGKMGACYNDESIACQQTNLGDQNNSKRFSSCPNYSISKRIEARQGTNSNTDNENKVCEGICAESQKWDKVESSVSIQVNNSTHLWYIILPSNKYLIIWDIWMMILLACVAFYIPYRVCLYWDENDSSDTASGIFMFELCTDIFFTLDIILNFFTAYQDGKTKKIITSPRMIALHYFRSSFFCGLSCNNSFQLYLVASIPWFNY